MMSRYEKLEQGRAERDSSNKFTDPALNSLVSRVRRESKIFRLIQNEFKKLKGQSKGKILSRCNYAAVENSDSEKKPPSYSYIILGEESKTFSRLQKPSEEDILLARKINKINSTISLQNACSSKMLVKPETELTSKMALDPDITKFNCETEQQDSPSDSGIDDTTNTNTSTDSSQTKIEEEEESEALASINLGESHNHSGDSGDKFVSDFDTASCHNPLSTNILKDHVLDDDSKVMSPGIGEQNKLEASSANSSVSNSEGMETICHLDDDQFDVEVSFCDNIEVLEENTQAYLVLETDEDGLEEVRENSNGKGHSKLDSDETTISLSKSQSTQIEEFPVNDKGKFNSKEQSENAEAIEDIQKFLLDSEKMENQNSTDDKNKRSSKTSDELFSKESALKIISQSTFFLKNNVRSELKTSKVQTFEDALNAATSPTKRQSKSIQVKSAKKDKGSNNKSRSTLGSSVRSNKASSKKSSPDKSPEKSPQLIQKTNVDVVSKIMAEQSKYFVAEPKKPASKLDPGSSTSKTKPGNISSASTSKKSKQDGSSYPLKEPSYEEIYRSLKKTILKDTTVKPFDQIIPKSLPRVETQSRPPLTPEPATQSQRPRAILPKPVPSHIDLGGTRGLLRDPVKTEARSRVQTSHGPHVSPVKRTEVTQGYYTSPVKVRSFDTYMATYLHDLLCQVKQEVKLDTKPTMLPSVFPTFDAPASAVRSLSSPDRPILSLTSMSVSGIASILQSASKPTAVVPPSSRTKLKMSMPILPKPVPAAIGTPSLAKPTSTQFISRSGSNPSSCGDMKTSVKEEFVCSRCGENFKSHTTLVTHQQSKHFYENF